MDESVKQQMREAYALIKAQKRKEAVDVLLPILQADEDNSDAWWLLANCLNDPNDAREALENVLRLRPDHEKAQVMMDAINARYPQPEPEPEPEEDDVFGYGDSASDPFAGFETEEAAAPVETFYEAEPVDDGDPFADFGDPFSAEADADMDEDPFAVGSASSAAFGEAEVFGGTPEPFGGPAETFGAPDPTPRQRRAAPQTDADSFGDPFGTPDAAAPAPPKQRPAKQKPAQQRRTTSGSSAKTRDPFAAGESVGAPVRAQSRSSSKSSGTNPIVLLLAVIGGISVVVCIGCGIIGLAAPAILSNLGDQVFNQLESQGFMSTLEASGAMSESFSFSNLGDAVARGSLSYGESRRDALGSGEQHAWTFNGNSGETVVIEMRATTSDGLDAYLSLYNASGAEIASDDDSGTDYNARLEYTLPASGSYTIVARTFGFSGGAYELSLNRR